MNDEKLAEFEKKLNSLAIEYGITDGAFTGNTETDYIGIIGINRVVSFQAVMNIGRLWQSAREQTRSILNTFERKW